MSVIRRFFAAALLLGLIVGAPIALWVFGRNLLPDHVPSWNEVKAFFTERDTGALFLGALVLIGIIAYLVFAISVLTEAASMLAGRRGQWQIPGFRLPQRAAAALLATLFTASIAVGTALPASAATAAPLAAAVRPYQHTAAATLTDASPARTQSATSSPARPSTGTDPRPASGTSNLQRGPTVTVGRYDTWWRIAEKTLGSGFRLPEIVTLNVGRPQADGGVVENADTQLRQGWVLRLPADAVVATDTTPPVAEAPPKVGADLRVQAQPGDTVSGITERATGDGDLWPAVAKASGMTKPDDLDVGQTVVIPAALIRQTDPGDHAAVRSNRQTVRVEPGDTLSEVAMRMYGDPALSPWLAQVNHIADPDVIIAGSTLLIPPHGGGTSATTPDNGAAEKVATQQAAAAQQAAAEKAAAAQAATQQAAAEKAAAAQAATRRAAAAQAAAQKNAAAEKESAATGPASTAPADAPAGGARATPAVAATSNHPDGAARADSSAVMPALAVSGGAVLLTGLAFAALVAARRRQFRWRRPGRAIPPTPPKLTAVERTLLTKGSDHVADVTWLDEALRTLAQELARCRPSRIPDVVAAKLTDQELQLVLALPTESAPSPWRVDDFGLRWTLDRSAKLPDLDRERSFGPLPALVSVGFTSAGEHWLIDLEMVGSILLTGDPERCLGLVRYMAAELAHNVWSDGLQVNLVGVGADLAAANPARLVCGDDLAPVLEQMRIQLDAVEEVSAAAAVDVAGGRLHNVAGDTWATQVVLVGPDAVGDRAELEKLLGRLRSSRGRQAAAVVVTVGNEGPRDTTRWVLEVDANGVLKVPALGAQMVAEQLPAAEAADLAALLALAATIDDVAVPPATGDAEWDAFADEAGALRPELTTNLDPSPLRLAGTSPERDGSVLPLPAHVYVAAAAVTEEDVEVLAPGVSPEVRKQVEWSSRSLDDDLAAWWDESNSTPKVTVLGPVAVRAPGVLDPQRPRLAWNTEVVVYLALMTAGVTAERMGLDLWPGEPDAHTKSKLRGAVTSARRWLGRNRRTGRDHLPTNAGVAGGRYRLEDVLVDAELFRRLRVRAVARGADGMADLQAALRLVSGVPLSDRRPRGYGWVGTMDHAFIGMVADTSHIVATHLLAGGQPEEAMAAAQVALRCGSYGDDVLLDCAATCYARGLTAEGSSYIRRIMDKHDAEVEEDLPQHTYEVLLSRGWLAS